MAMRRSLLRLSSTASRAWGSRFYSHTRLIPSSCATVESRRTAVKGIAVAGGFAFAGLGISSFASAEEATADIAKIRSEIEELVDEGHGPIFVRLAWHAAGTFDKASGTGGSSGAKMRFSPEADHGANAGLQVARDLLEPIKARNPEISYADLWTLASCVAIETMGGPELAWKAGRTDDADGANCTPDGRLPGADMGQAGKTVSHIRDVFYRMGFNDQEIVALLGAHALGRCHTDRSGYWGPWTRAETSFSNEYYRELIENTWTLKKWDGPEQFEDPTGDLMMLPSDMALLWDKEFRKHVEIYAKDSDAFYADFSKAYMKLMELGVKFPSKGWFGIFG
ncbi:heme peroxidase [Cymbomonas tetramitiformis]|uniref:Cytochrome c peroxidase, mitochondrial n=1 Tax=Cymbomonas tetramitiformis TaxID=36881 RepID=A0AAE0CBE8_9CHLO|nr:heme peroxidase [Cymbomonas tetramitiformis]KAK3251224.1 heme peroxidase [Cymbomonas tetramitiformis]